MLRRAPKQAIRANEGGAQDTGVTIMAKREDKRSGERKTNEEE